MTTFHGHTPEPPLARLLDDRRQQVARADAIGPDLYAVSGEVQLDGVGGTTFDVAFPVRFTEKPHLSLYIELGTWARVDTVDDLPRVDFGVAGWVAGVRRGTGSRYYDGATIWVVIDAHADNRPIVNWRFEGTSLPGARDDTN